MTDVEIIDRTLAGDLDGFRTLVERHQRRIYSLTFAMSRDHHLSEDIAQDVFIEAFHRLATFDPDRAQFSTWLYRIAHNKTLNALKRKRPLFFAEVPEACDAQDVRQQTELEELHSELDRALARLPDNQRIAFVWAEIEQLSYEEIAAIEGTSVSAVKSRINRARQTVQAALEDRRPTSHA